MRKESEAYILYKQQYKFPKWKDYMFTLDEMHKREHYAVFHPAIKEFKEFLKQLENERYFNKKIEGTSDEKADIILEKGQEYFVTKEGWEWLLKRRVLTKEEMECEDKIQSALSNKENHLIQLLDIACKLIIKENEKEALKLKEEENEKEALKLKEEENEKEKEDKQNKKKKKTKEDIHLDEDIVKLVQEESFVKFLYDYICLSIIQNGTINKNKDYFVGKAKMGVDFGMHLCRLIIARRIDVVDKVIAEIEEVRINVGSKWTEQQANNKLKIIFAICEAKEYNDLKFEALNITFDLKSIEIKELLFYYMKTKMEKIYSFLRTGIYKNPHISDTLKARAIRVVYDYDRYTIEKYRIRNKLTEFCVKVGLYFIANIYEKYGILKEILGRQEGKEIRKIDKTTKAPINIVANQYGYTIDAAIITQIITTYKLDVPILNPIYDDLIPEFAKKSEKFRIINEQEKHIIHANENITMKIHSDNILHEEKGEMSVKYCIDFEYFGRFLWVLYELYDYLVNFKNYPDLYCKFRNSHDNFHRAYIQMHNINLERYDELVVKYPETKIVMDYLYCEIVQFKKLKTKKEIMKEILDLYELEKFDPRNKFFNMYPHKSDRQEKWYNSLPHKDLLEEFIDIMCHRKLFMVRLIIDCIEHVVFDNFIVRHFLDARGRVYPRITYMNINGNHAAKLFVRLYDENSGNAFTEGTIFSIMKNLKNKETRRKMAAIDLANIEQENDRIKEEYILSLCHKDCTIEEVRDWINNDKYHLDCTSTYLLLDIIKPKKPKEHLFIHSLICAQRYVKENSDSRFIVYAEKDATSSGLQMISILFRSETLASYSNLISGNTKDIYSLITAACKEHKDYLLYIASHTLNYVGCPHYLGEMFSTNNMKLSLEEFEYFRKQTIGTKDHYYATIERHRYFLWYLCNVKYTLGSKKNIEQIGFFFVKILDVYKKYMPELIPYYENIKFENEEKLNNYLSEDEKLLISYLPKISPFKHTFWKKLFVIRASLRLSVIIKVVFPFIENSKIWEGRDLFKQAVMTRFYNSTSFGRVKDFIECLKTHHLLPQGYENNHFFNEFINFLDSFFVRYLAQIPDTDKLDLLSKDISHNKKCVLINNQFFFIEIAPKKMYTRRIVSTFRTHAKKTIKRSQLCLKFYATEEVVKDDPSNKVDPSIVRKRKRKHKKQPIHDESKLVDNRKLYTMLGPNIIHSMDSTIVHLLYNLVCSINEGSDVKFVLEMNHDCYIISCPILLPILLEECYLRLCKMNYLQNISDLIIDEQWKTYECMNLADFRQLLTPINPRFIK